jgi:hypothetical protein
VTKGIRAVEQDMAAVMPRLDTRDARVAWIEADADALHDEMVNPAERHRAITISVRGAVVWDFALGKPE